MKFSLDAPAKINWFLSVGGKRPDGYHDIVSVMQCVSLFDRLTFEEADDVELVSGLDLPVEKNLVYRAAMRLKERFSAAGGARITLEKNIPEAAGLGGGSSDGAVALAGLNRLWGLNLSPETLSSVGAELGSDVPFFMGGPCSLAEGRGEKVSPLDIRTSLALLLVNPGVRVSTAWAYNAYAPKLTKKDVNIKLFCQALDGKDLASLRGMVVNDLEQAVIAEHHVIGEIKELLVESGAAFSLMSGSGSTVFGVFGSEGEARSASTKVGDYWCRVVRTLSADERLTGNGK